MVFFLIKKWHFDWWTVYNSDNSYYIVMEGKFVMYGWSQLRVYFHHFLPIPEILLIKVLWPYSINK